MDFSELTARLHEHLPRLLAALPVAAVIVIGAVVINLVIGRLLLVIANRTSLTAMDVLPIRRILGWAVRLLAFILILGVFGFEIGGLWAMLSTLFGLVAIGFVAVWSLISHVTATVLVLILRPFQVGDDLEFPGESVRGRVVDLNFFFTTLLDHEGQFQQVPNNLFFQKTLRRRRNDPPVRLSAQLNASEPLDLPRPPPPSAAASGTGPQKLPDPLLNVPDPASLKPHVRIT